MVQEKKFINVLEGTTLAIGEPAYLLCRNRDTGAVNVLQTSPVQDFFQGLDGKIKITTRNSIYRN